LKYLKKRVWYQFRIETNALSVILKNGSTRSIFSNCRDSPVNIWSFMELGT